MADVDLYKEFLADLLLGLVSNEMNVPQAVKRVDDFCDKLTLPEKTRLEVKATLLRYVFSFQEQKPTSLYEQLRDHPTMPANIDTRPEWQRKGLEYFDDDDYGEAGHLWVWIRQHLPKHMVDTEEKRNLNAKRIAFFVGLLGEQFVVHYITKITQWLEILGVRKKG